jgi:hypothetical protein
LDSMDFTIELVFYHILELIETAKDFWFLAQQIDPSILAIVIDKTYIIIMPTHWCWCRTPYIGKYKFKRTRWQTSRLGMGNWWLLPCWHASHITLFSWSLTKESLWWLRTSWMTGAAACPRRWCHKDVVGLNTPSTCLLDGIFKG